MCINFLSVIFLDLVELLLFIKSNFLLSCFEVSNVNRVSASFNSGRLLSSLSIDIIGLGEADCDSASLEDVGVKSKGT